MTDSKIGNAVPERDTTWHEKQIGGSKPKIVSVQVLQKPVNINESRQVQFKKRKRSDMVDKTCAGRKQSSYDGSDSEHEELSQKQIKIVTQKENQNFKEASTNQVSDKNKVQFKRKKSKKRCFQIDSDVSESEVETEEIDEIVQKNKKKKGTLVW